MLSSPFADSTRCVIMAPSVLEAAAGVTKDKKGPDATKVIRPILVRSKDGAAKILIVPKGPVAVAKRPEPKSPSAVKKRRERIRPLVLPDPAPTEPNEVLMVRGVPCAADNKLPMKRHNVETLRRRTCYVSHCGPPWPPDVSFHRIPRDKDRAKKWRAALGIADPDKMIANPMVCSQHFGEGDFTRDLNYELMHGEQRRKLKNTAVPCRFLKEGQKEKEAEEAPRVEARRKRMERRQQQSMVQDLLDAAPPPEPRQKDAEVQVEMDNPREEENYTLRLHLQAMSQRLERLECKHQRENSEEATEAKRLEIAREVMAAKTSWSKAQVAHFLMDKKWSKWTPEDIQLGQTLRAMMSKKTYLFLRRKGLLPLPGLSTIKDYKRKGLLKQQQQPQLEEREGDDDEGSDDQDEEGEESEGDEAAAAVHHLTESQDLDVKDEWI